MFPVSIFLSRNELGGGDIRGSFADVSPVVRRFQTKCAIVVHWKRLHFRAITIESMQSERSAALVSYPAVAA